MISKFKYLYSYKLKTLSREEKKISRWGQFSKAVTLRRNASVEVTFSEHFRTLLILAKCSSKDAGKFFKFIYKREIPKHQGMANHKFAIIVLQEQWRNHHAIFPFLHRCQLQAKFSSSLKGTQNTENVGLFLVLMSESAGSPIQQDWGLKSKFLLLLNGEGRCKLFGQKAGILSEAIPASKLV